MTIIRPYIDNDAADLIALFTETVRRINIRDYTPEQIAVWAPKETDRVAWKERFSRCMTLVAEDERGIAGFGQLEVNGHIDCFYVAHDRIGSGIGSMLLRASWELECSTPKQASQRVRSLHGAGSGQCRNNRLSGKELR